MFSNKGVHKGCNRISTQQEVNKSTEEWLKRVIKGCDKDGDGRLSKQELKQAINILGSNFPAWRAWRALCYADSDGDGYVSEDEYDLLVSYLSKHIKQGSAKKAREDYSKLPTQH
ncbi:putative Calcium-binding EF-hand family protein [Melia azedarach]|uniref:Calcium-binding EF-hand family protein n=1 Tax=Melia azedarach TaxID=155640 RepID=A0ACC1WTZ4_MELAZ|nr:putative Calcium-binding EF-hand family protein [Melia azedarach]